MSFENYNLENIEVHGRFVMKIKHKECGTVIGLVKGGLTGMFCFCCDTMVQEDEIVVSFR